MFIAGGDQSDYTNFWLNTPVQDVFNERIKARVPVGGTSAGMAVLTQFIYNGDGADSSEALQDPYSALVSFDRNFVDVNIAPGVKGILGVSF